MRDDTDVFESKPWERTDDGSWRFREANLWRRRVASVTRLVEALRQETGSHVPWLDPFCGGVEAPILLVMLRPGPRGAMASNFLSLANRDATAANTIEIVRTAGLRYTDMVFWNAIPWAGPREEKITAPMLQRGASMLGRMLVLLPRLRAIVLVGNEAQRLERSIASRADRRVLKCAHPGPFVWNQHRYEELKRGIFETFQAAAAIARSP